MSSTKYNLLVVAHPDDEAIFFAGLLQSERRYSWMVICVTDANADGQGALRRRQFARSMRLLKIKNWHWWGFPDVFEKRLKTDVLIARLSELPPGAQMVFTHSIIGEYMHPHHQDVSFCVHQAFARHRKLYVPAYNAFPDFSISLSKKQFALKTQLLTKVYGTETSRFLNILPATWAEGFVRLSGAEVSNLYGFLRGSSHTLSRRSLRAYSWLAKYLETRPMKKRLF